MLPNAPRLRFDSINQLKKRSKLTDIQIRCGRLTGAPRGAAAPRTNQPIVGIVKSAPPFESVGHRTVTVFLRV